MRRVVLAGPYDLRIEQISKPLVARGHVLVRVEAAGVCGSDLHGYRGVNDRRPPGTVLGHEISGYVEQVGVGVDPAWLRREVAINPILGCDRCPACRAGRVNHCPHKTLIGCSPEHPGGFADFVHVPASTLTVWPGPAPLAWGAFAEPLAVGLHAVSHVPCANRRVLIAGSGPIAVVAGIAAVRAGAQVAITEGDSDRFDILRAHGLLPLAPAEVAVAAPFDVVVDCVADDASLELALGSLRIGGTVIVVGLAQPYSAVSMARLVQGERIVRGSAQYPYATYREAVQWLASGALDISGLITCHPLIEAPCLFRSWNDDSRRSVRSLLTPQSGR